MIKKLFSMKMAITVLLIFAVSIGYATFIENDYGTQTARALIYNAKWFEILLFYFISIVIYNIFAFKMYKHAKWGQLVLHLSFLLIAIGAATTRYVGYEGVLHLREGQASDKMVSDHMVLTIGIKDGNKSYIFDRDLILSSMTKNRVEEKIKVGDKEIDIKLLKYLPTAEKGVVKVENGGSDYLEFMISSAGARGGLVYIKKGDYLDLGSLVLAYDIDKKFNKDVVNISRDANGTFVMTSSRDIKSKSMDTMQDTTLKAGKNILQKRHLNKIDGTMFVLKNSYSNAKIDYVSKSLKSSSMTPQMIELQISSGKDSKKVRLFGQSGAVGETKVLNLNGMDIGLQYGAKVIPLPFKIELDKFELDRYPGSMSPSSYSSWVRVIDNEKKRNFKYHIFMNHVLDYRGYRFFQSSFDGDEKGSILSVNHDPGTLPTYIGYMMLAIGFLWSFLSEKGRIKTLLKKLDKLDKKAIASAVVLLMLTIGAPLKAGSIDTATLTKDELSKIQKIDLNSSEKFARLIVQESTGRMEPMDSLALEVVRKISTKKGFLGLNYNQIFIGMIVEPEIYHKVRMVKISHPALAKKLGLKKGAEFASFNDFFTKNGEGDYKIAVDVDKAKKKRAAERSKYENELIKVDEKLNVMYMTDQGYLLKLFPKPNDPNNTWYNPIDAVKAFPTKEGQVVKYIVSSYLRSATDGIKSGDWKKANEALEVIHNFQKFYGSKIMPTSQKVEAEIYYNRLGLFDKLAFVYMTIGLILLVLAFISIVKPNVNLKVISRLVVLMLVLTLMAHTFGLGLRWYIAEHAPWSNAYESILYIAWATAVAGFVFAKRSPLAFAATSILAGIFLLVAFISSLNPQITNLVPVLKSYWLMIHVAVITASYGFLGLGALLGMFTLVLMIVNGRKESESIKRAIKELTIINEITLLIGLAMLTVGNFLGGVWANESWGRYWGWDSKETWAAVTILVYAAVLHIRFIPKLNSLYAFNVASVLGYFSVVMTYFGVNYYLSGMHSYAAGDPVPIPIGVYFAVASVFVLIAVAYKYRLKGKL